MKVSQINKSNNPDFGMKFSFVKHSPRGNWQKAEKCFFDEVQLAIIKRKVEALNPKTDEFILNLDLPTFKVEKDLQNRYFLSNSYDMEVCLKDNTGETMSFDLGASDVKLNLFEPKDTLLIHPQGPFSKLYDFVEVLVSRNGTK